MQVMVARSGMAESASKIVAYHSVRNPEKHLEKREVTTIKVMIHCSQQNSSPDFQRH
jgi:hypothetical protein